MDLAEVIKGFNRPKKIGVCTAWGSPFTWTHAAYNMANLIRPEGVEVMYFPGFGRDPARRHMWGIEHALEWGASHVCFLGADQMHDLDILVKFCRHFENGWPMVTALVPIRGWVAKSGAMKPFQRVAWKIKDELKENGLVDIKFDQSLLEMIDPNAAELQEVHVVGSGALMFDVALLDNLSKPWFREAKADDFGNRPATMDTTFCWRMITEAGGRLLADCSIKVYHLDVFPIDDSYGDRFSDWPTKEKDEPIVERLTS